MTSTAEARIGSDDTIAMIERGRLATTRTSNGLSIDITGAWLVDHIAALDQERIALLDQAGRWEKASVDISVSPHVMMDTAGAWLISRLANDFREMGWQATIVDAAPRHRSLIDEVRRVAVTTPVRDRPANGLLSFIESLGRHAIENCVRAGHLLSFFGQAVTAVLRAVIRPTRLRLTSLTHHLEQTCLNALPIVGLIAFLLGIVIAYQGADQLARFGAELFTVNLVGVSILREIAILLTAIVVAGRSGSAFTAEIGAMAVNQEIDALRTLGLDPIEVLVVPRMLALMIALPLLAFFADILGLLGGACMAWFVLDISPAAFIAQLKEAIGPATFAVGMVKAPVFAFLIAIVGCYQGLQVSGSADSVGRNTTRSVVTGIFLVIVFDALFSILFSYLGV